MNPFRDQFFRHPRYEFLSGTSMATPHVSGVAALVLDYVDTLTYAELRNLILTSGVSYLLLV